MAQLSMGYVYGYANNNTSYGYFQVYLNYTSVTRSAGSTTAVVNGCQMSATSKSSSGYTTNTIYIGPTLTLNTAAASADRTTNSRGGSFAGNSYHGGTWWGPAAANVSVGNVPLTTTSMGVSIPVGRTGSNPNATLTGSLTVPSGWVAPSWTTYTITSSPATAYANMPYTYNITLGANFGSSTANNLLYWEAAPGNSGYVTMVSTTGTSIAAGSRTFTFTRAQIATYVVRGVIRSNNSAGTIIYTVHGTTYPLTVSFLNPTITNGTVTPNKINYFRTSTVELDCTGTVTANSADPPSIYVYSDAPSATGDGSGQGYFKIGEASFSNVVKSYTHPGTETGTFNTRLSLRGYNGANAWTEFATYGATTYAMQPFVAPTATRTIIYNKNNVYVGQTLFPVTINVTSVYRSPYDSLTPIMRTGTKKGADWFHDGLIPNTWAVGTYNITLSKTGTLYEIGDIARFANELVWQDVNNTSAYGSVVSDDYVVLEMPSPTSADINVSLAKNSDDSVTMTVTGDIDSDFRCYYTLYFESADGSTQYMSYNDYLVGTDYREYNYSIGGLSSGLYRARLVCYFALSNETTVTGSSTTMYSNTIDVTAYAKLCVKSSDVVTKYIMLTEPECPKPRLVAKNGSTMHYLPLTTVEIFDKNTAQVANISMTPEGVLGGDNNARLLYFACEPNTTYIITRAIDVGSNRFRVGTTSDTLPPSGVWSSVTINQIIVGTDISQPSITVKTGDTDKFICVYLVLSANATSYIDAILPTLSIQQFLPDILTMKMGNTAYQAKRKEGN